MDRGPRSSHSQRVAPANCAHKHSAQKPATPQPVPAAGESPDKAVPNAPATNFRPKALRYTRRRRVRGLDSSPHALPGWHAHSSVRPGRTKRRRSQYHTPPHESSSAPWAPSFPPAHRSSDRARVPHHGPQVKGVGGRPGTPVESRALRSSFSSAVPPVELAFASRARPSAKPRRRTTATPPIHPSLLAS